MGFVAQPDKDRQAGELLQLELFFTEEREGRL